MKKYRLAFFIFLAVLIVMGIALLFYFIFVRVPVKTLQFAESNKVLVNPGRGFYVQFDADHTDKMKELREKGITLALVAFDISDFANREISNEKLQELSNALLSAEKNGLQVIVRTAYGFDSSDRYKDPSNIEIVKKHIAQIAPVINRSHAVLCVQAGFLGPWGEWHSSNLLTDNEESNTLVRNEIIRNLQAGLDKSVMIAVRRPRFVRDAVAVGLDITRIGVHNDALVSTENDMGTYDDAAYNRTQELNWINSSLNNGINGGEMPQIGTYSASENALKEFKLLHLTYLNHEYNTDVLNSWNSDTLYDQNALQYIGSHLGYRFSLQTAKMPQRIAESSSVKMEFSMTNTGFASIAKNGSVQVVIKCQDNTYAYPVETDSLCTLQPDSQLVMKTNITLPKQPEGEELQVGLKIEEQLGLDQSNSFNCIELANENVQYEDDINYFCTYRLEDKKYTLCE